MMNYPEYAHEFFPKLYSYFADKSDIFLAYGKELVVKDSFPDNVLPVRVRELEHLYEYAAEWAMEVFLPINGRNNDFVMMPFDFEVSGMDKNFKKELYCHPDSQLHFFKKYIKPVADYVAEDFIRMGLPFFLEYTPSGGHFLVYAMRGTEGWDALASSGYADKDLIRACQWCDGTGEDLKRKVPMGLDAIMVYSTLGRLAEFEGLRLMREFAADFEQKDNVKISLWDAYDDDHRKLAVVDTSWAADPAYMRIIRAPGSKQNKRKKAMEDETSPPLVDVGVRYFDTKRDIMPCRDLREQVYMMWNFRDTFRDSNLSGFEGALEHNLKFPGYIPWGNEGFVNWVNEYNNAKLSEFYEWCEQGEKEMNPTQARADVMADGRLNDKSRDLARAPNFRAKNPAAVTKYARDLFGNGWHPLHIANSIEGCYRDKSQGWPDDWEKYRPGHRSRVFVRSMLAASLYDSFLRREEGGMDLLEGRL